MGEKDDLMSPEEVAIEVIEDIEEEFPSIMQKVNSKSSISEQELKGREIEGRLMYQIQDAKIATYNMHMNLQGYEFPLDDASDFSNHNKFQELLNWLDRYYPS